MILRQARDARRARTIDRTDTRSILANRSPGRFDMEVAQPFAGIEDPFRNEIGGMQPRKPGIRRLGQEHLSQLRDQRIHGIRTPCKISEPRIAGKVVASDGRAQSVVLRLVHQSDHHPAVSGLV